MTTSQYKTRQAELNSQIDNAKMGSPEWKALMEESDRMYDERKAQAKALRKQIAALSKQIDEIENNL